MNRNIRKLGKSFDSIVKTYTVKPAYKTYTVTTELVQSFRTAKTVPSPITCISFVNSETRVFVSVSRVRAAPCPRRSCFFKIRILRYIGNEIYRSLDIVNYFPRIKHLSFTSCLLFDYECRPNFLNFNVRNNFSLVKHTSVVCFTFFLKTFPIKFTRLWFNKAIKFFTMR